MTTKPEPIGTRKTKLAGMTVDLPVYADLVDIAEAGVNDAYTEAGPRFYLIDVEADKDLGEPGGLHYAPYKGGSCLSLDRLLNDPVLRQAIRRTAAMRRKV